MFNIAVCDDGEKERGEIVSLLRKYEPERSGIGIYPCDFDSGRKLLESIQSGQGFDLFLLDTIMPGLSGIELAKELRRTIGDTPIIFLTSSPDYALDAYRVSAEQYLLKPIREEELFPILDKFLSPSKRKKDRFFVLQTTERTIKIEHSTIIHMELNDHIIRVYLESGETLLSKTLRVSFQTAIAPLLEDSRFLYAHKSYLINMDHVQEISGKTFVMTGGYNIPIPKNKIAEAKKRYFQHLSKYSINCMGGEK